MIQTDLLQGEKLSLRAMEPEDLDTLYTLENDTTLWDISSVNVPYSRYALKQFIATGAHDIYTDGQLRLMVQQRSDKKVVGMVDLVEFNHRHLRAEVGIVVAKAYRSHGYGTEILALIEKYGKEFLHLHQLYAYVSASNEASINLFEKAGYQDTCTLIDWLYKGSSYEDTKIFQKFFTK